MPRVHNFAAHTARAWTAALRAVPKLHTLEADAPAEPACLDFIYERKQRPAEFDVALRSLMSIVIRFWGGCPYPLMCG